MPRANRHSFPGQVWHITHRCHNRQWLLKFNKDRLRWVHWLFKARQRFDLCVLNYMVTSNHIHLLVQDRGKLEIARSMQLIAGRTAQEFNRRKKRKGAFWEDRYHATAVQTDHHLARCMTYIDLNMVRAGAIRHPDQWRYCGFHELINPPLRKNRLDMTALLQLFNQSSPEALIEFTNSRIEEKLKSARLLREGMWSEAVVVGDEAFVCSLLDRDKSRYPGLNVFIDGEDFILREPQSRYSMHSGSEMCGLRPKLAPLTAQS